MKGKWMKRVTASFLAVSLFSPISQVWANELNGNNVVVESVKVNEELSTNNVTTQIQNGEAVVKKEALDQHPETSVTTQSETTQQTVNEEAPVQSIEEAAEQHKSLTAAKVEVQNVVVPTSNTKYVTAIELPLYFTYQGLSDSNFHLDPTLGRSGQFLKYKDVVIILDEKNYAVQVQTEDGSKTGWIHKDYLSENIIDRTWLLKEWRNLRQGPGTSYPMVNVNGVDVKIPDNSIVVVLDYVAESNYYLVQTEDGIQGWVYGLYIDSKTNEAKNFGNNLIQYEFEKENGITNQISIFTPLNSVANITAGEINRYIEYKTGGDKNRLIFGMGEAYLEAQNVSGLNAIYLLAHSALETGWGSSKIVSDKYNFYGIGAFDSNPYGMAYDFSTPKNGIIAGAIWINGGYISRDEQSNVPYPIIQPTLDNMRYNQGYHQYATDEAWAVKIATIAKDFYQYTFKNGEQLKVGWYQDGNFKYLFDQNGRMKTGWYTEAGKRYYFELSGSLKKGWLQDQGKWYYFTPDTGIMKTGWHLVNGKWYFFNANGDMRTGWFAFGGKWYYLNSVTGIMHQGWLLDKYKWYYMDSNGVMKTSWLFYNGKWYHLNAYGTMDTGWKYIGGKWYFFYNSGIMAANTTIGGYRLGSSGTWIR